MSAAVTPIPTRRMDIYRHLHACIISDCDFMDGETTNE